MAVKPVPDGYTSVAPYLFVEDSRAAIEFYKRAFGAREHGLIATPDGRVAHAEVKIGDTVPAEIEARAQATFAGGPTTEDNSRRPKER